MNNIEDLIEELCPNRVEWKELGEVCEFQRGQSITQKDTIVGDVPVIAGGQKPAYYHNSSNRNSQTIAVSGSGAYAGFVSFWEIPIFLSDAFSVNPSKDLLLKKYVYHFLKHNQGRIHGTKKGSGVPHVHGSSIAKFQIPIPPLPIQQEIVRILDTFTDLDASLQTELEARKKQYEHYRDQLLNFDGKEVEWKMLGEVCENIGSGKNMNKTQHGKFPVYGSTGLIGYSNSFAYDGEYILVARVGANAGYIHKVKGKFDVSDNTLIVKPKVGYKLSFAYYQLINFDFNKIAVGGGQPLITASKIKRYNVPIPPLSQQERIVSILDKFDALVNDISVGLPAEIDARRKQYEYYRKKLLTFEPLTNLPL